jgi:hypothetical protein
MTKGKRRETLLQSPADSRGGNPALSAVNFPFRERIKQALYRKVNYRDYSV